MNLTIGQPDFPMPDSVKQAYIKAIELDHTSYSHNKGLLEARKAISQYFNDKYHFIYSQKKKLLLQMVQVKRLIHPCAASSNLEMKY